MGQRDIDRKQEGGGKWPELLRRGKRNGSLVFRPNSKLFDGMERQSAAHAHSQLRPSSPSNIGDRKQKIFSYKNTFKK